MGMTFQSYARPIPGDRTLVHVEYKDLQGGYKVGTHGNIHSIGSHTLSFRDIDLEVGIKNVQKGKA